MAVDARLVQQQGLVSISFEQRQAAADHRLGQLQESVDRRFDQMQDALIRILDVNASQKQLESHNTCYSSTLIGAPNDRRSTNDMHISTSPRPSLRRKQSSVLIARFRFRLPHWLLNRSLEFEIYRSSRCWTLNLSPRRVVSEDCELFQCILRSQRPRVLEVERMIVERRASLYDVDRCGRNILHVS